MKKIDITTKKDFLAVVKRFKLMKTFMIAVYTIRERHPYRGKTIEEVIDELVREGHYNSQGRIVNWLNDWQSYINHNISTHPYNHTTIFCEKLGL